MKPIGVAIFALCLFACGVPKTAAAPPALSPTAVSLAQVRWPDATPASLASGREIFLAKCNACHGYPDIRAVDESRWPDILRTMAERARIDDAQRESVLRFVTAVRME